MSCNHPYGGCALFFFMLLSEYFLRFLRFLYGKVMSKAQKLDQLIGVLYETVLEPSRLSEAVELCWRFAGGADGHLATFTNNLATSGVIPGLSQISHSPVSIADYENYYCKIDPRLKPLSEKALHEWSSCNQTFSQSFVDHNEFYQDFYIAHGLRYAMSALIDDFDRRYYLVVQRAVGQKPFELAHQLAAQRFSVHLQRTLRLQHHTQELQTKVELGAMALDVVVYPMFIVDNKGFILHLNAEAERLLADPASGLAGKSGFLNCIDLDAKSRLTDLISKATAYPAMGGGLFLMGSQVRQLFVTPLPAVSPLSQDWQMPLALVLLTDADKNISTLQFVGQLYDFSAAEIRLASALLACKSLQVFAQEVGLTQNTVRSQLKNLFGKTGVHSQSELIALLSRGPPLQNDIGLISRIPTR